MKLGVLSGTSAAVIAASAVLVIVIALSVLAPWLSPSDPTAIRMSERFAPFSTSHPLGTDHLGRDMLSRLLYGGRYTIVLALAASAVTMLIGLVIGATAGYFGGKTDLLTQWLVQLFQGLPGLSLMLAIAGTLGPGAMSIFIAVVATSWADFSRIVRGEVLKLREEHYVEAIRSLGASHAYILRHYIIPNLIGPIVVLFTVRIGRTMLSVASLSFLGLGLQPPLPDWGVMVSDSRAYFRSHPHLMLMPGACIAVVSLAINLLGDGLRDVLDPRDERRQEL